MPSPTRVLLTGADSLVGLHVLDLLASNDDVSIHALVTSEESVRKVQQHYAQRFNSVLDVGIATKDDLLMPGAFDAVFVEQTQPFESAIHILNAIPTEEADCLARYINLEKEAVISFLNSVLDLAKGVRRVVVVTTLTPYARWLTAPQIERAQDMNAYPTTNTAVNDAPYVLATSQAGDNIVYEGVVEWMKKTKAHFDIVWITAPSVYGPSVHQLETSSDLSEANRRIWNICSNDRHDRKGSPPYSIDYYLDVRDLALAAVRALHSERASNKRFSISAGTMPCGSEIAKLLIRNFPALQGRLRLDGSPPYTYLEDDPASDFADTYVVSVVIGISQYRALEDTLTDTAQQILDLQQRKDWRKIIQS